MKLSSKEEAARLAAVQVALTVFGDRQPHARRELFGDIWDARRHVGWQYFVLDRLKQHGHVERLKATYRWIAVDAPATTAEAAAAWLWLRSGVIMPAAEAAPSTPVQVVETAPSTTALAELTTEQKLDVLVANVIYLREEWAEVRPMIERIYQDLIK